MKRKNLLFVSIISLLILVLGTINISKSYSDVRLVSTDNEGEGEDHKDTFSSLSRMLGEKDSGEDSGEDSGSKGKDSGEDSGEDSGSKGKDSKRER